MGLNFSRQQLSLLSGMSSLVPSSSNRNSFSQGKNNPSQRKPAAAPSSHSSQGKRASLSFLLNYTEASRDSDRKISFNHA